MKEFDTSCSYYRVMLGKKSTHAENCFEHGFIGAHYGIDQDLNEILTDEIKSFNEQFVGMFLDVNPTKSKMSASMSGGMMHALCKRLNIGDVVLSPNGKGFYRSGIVTSDYHYLDGQILPHRRSVKWNDALINRQDVSEQLKNSTNSSGTVAEITRYKEEIERLIKGDSTKNPEDVDGSGIHFSMEKHLEDFLISNWDSCEFGELYNVVEDEGEIIGQQYPTDTGPIDILAISKDKKTLLVIELKKGRASDSVVGQIQRYMGYVVEEVAEEDQDVRGCIIALEDDLRIRRALKINPSISFYRYKINFELVKQ